jgi:hypothetical protein
MRVRVGKLTDRWGHDIVCRSGPRLAWGQGRWGDHIAQSLMTRTACYYNPNLIALNVKATC